MSCDGNCRCCKNLQRALFAQNKAEDERDEWRAIVEHRSNASEALDKALVALHSAESKLCEIAERERDEARAIAAEYHGLWSRAALPGADISPLPWNTGEPDAAGLFHDSVHKDVGRARVAKAPTRPKPSQPSYKMIHERTNSADEIRANIRSSPLVSLGGDDEEE